MLPLKQLHGGSRKCGRAKRDVVEHTTCTSQLGERTPRKKAKCKYTRGTRTNSMEQVATPTNVAATIAGNAPPHQATSGISPCFARTRFGSGVQMMGSPQYYKTEIKTLQQSEGLPYFWRRIEISEHLKLKFNQNVMNIDHFIFFK